jgi:ABC-2 type transport system permease protein
MNGRRILALARRVIRQIAFDRRTLGLVILAPMMMLTLGAILFRLEQAPIPLGVVNEDEGMSLPGDGSMELGSRIADELAASEAFILVDVQPDEIDDRLRDGTAQAVVVLPDDFTTQLVGSSDHQAAVDLRLEGSNPTRNRLITARVTEAAMKGMAGLAVGGFGLVAGQSSDAGGTALPIAIDTSYLFGSESLDTLDYIAPSYIAFLAFFFVFLLTCVAFLRERSQGTMERLLATPATRPEIIVGYLGGLGLFALIQVAVIVVFTIWVLQVHYMGSLALLLMIIGLLALVGVSIGILASTFARNEFQVIQFIPIVIIPQALLCGMIWPVEELPAYLQPLAYVMPLTYANRALRDVMLKGESLSAILPDLLILIAFGLFFVALGALTLRRELT